MKRAIFILVCFASFSVGMLQADEGRIPVFGPTTIAQPGHYIVTRDIASQNTPVISINASNVTLDLNGHLISAPQFAAASVIEILDPATDIRIHNGRLMGGFNGIEHLNTPIRLRVENVEIKDSEGGIIVLPERVEVRGCRIENVLAGIEAESSAPWTGRFIDNTIVGVAADGMSLDFLTGGEVRGNIVRNTAGGAPAGCNVIDWAIEITGEGNRVEDNEVSGGKAGISIGGNGNLILGNVVRSNFSACATSGYGLSVSGARNLMDRNQIEGNGGCGISFAPGTADNAYRTNMLRGNTGGAVCGPANTDGGGNIL